MPLSIYEINNCTRASLRDFTWLLGPESALAACALAQRLTLSRPAEYIFFGNSSVVECVPLNADSLKAFVVREIGSCDPIGHKGGLLSVVEDNVFKPDILLAGVALLKERSHFVSTAHDSGFIVNNDRISEVLGHNVVEGIQILLKERRPNCLNSKSRSAGFRAMIISSR